VNYEPVIAGQVPSWGMPGRRYLNDFQFVEIKHVIRWKVNVRYHFGPFAPRIEHRTFWRKADALSYADSRVVSS